MRSDFLQVGKKRRMDPEDDAKHKRQKKDGQAARHAANANSKLDLYVPLVVKVDTQTQRQESQT
mgnify:CR=1 FL=1